MGGGGGGGELGTKPLGAKWLIGLYGYMKYTHNTTHNTHSNVDIVLFYRRGDIELSNLLTFSTYLRHPTKVYVQGTSRPTWERSVEYLLPPITWRVIASQFFMKQ